MLSSSSLAHTMLGSALGRYPSASTVRADEKPISGRERLCERKTVTEHDGVAHAKLSKVLGVSEAEFCHPAQFAW